MRLVASLTGVICFLNAIALASIFGIVHDPQHHRAKHWLDHNNIGESNIFWPITWSYAMIQGWELTLRSPNLFHRDQLHNGAECDEPPRGA